MNSKLPLAFGVLALVFFSSCGDVPHDNPFDPNFQRTQPCSAAPAISSVSPSSGKGGDSVTINGSNLSNITTVSFDILQGTITTRSAAQASVIVPSRQTAGAVGVTVSNACGSATLPNSFTY